MTSDEPKADKPNAQAQKTIEKEARLAENLRANLRRRKAAIKKNKFSENPPKI